MLLGVGYPVYVGVIDSAVEGVQANALHQRSKDVVELLEELGQELESLLQDGRIRALRLLEQ